MFQIAVEKGIKRPQKQCWSTKNIRRLEAATAVSNPGSYIRLSMSPTTSQKHHYIHIEIAINTRSNVDIAYTNKGDI